MCPSLSPMCLYPMFPSLPFISCALPHTFCVSHFAEFDQSSRLMLVNTPPDGTATPLVLTVQRIGGTVGVIGVDWSLAPVNGENTYTCSNVYGMHRELLSYSYISFDFLSLLLPNLLPCLVQVLEALRTSSHHLATWCSYRVISQRLSPSGCSLTIHLQSQR